MRTRYFAFALLMTALALTACVAIEPTPGAGRVTPQPTNEPPAPTAAPSVPAGVTAVQVAQTKDMTIVALTGRGGGKLGQMLSDTDVHICIPHERTARIQEVHILALHCICDAVDTQLLGEQDRA